MMDHQESVIRIILCLFVLSLHFFLFNGLFNNTVVKTEQ